MITIDPPSRSIPDDPAISQAGLVRFLGRARRAVGLTGLVDVLLTTDSAMRRLNRSFRGKDRATDVLSFPAAPEAGMECAGDLAISVETAARQARRFGHTLDVELRVLLLHGLLHLAGMDHETDGGEMAVAEERLRAELRLPGSLIERVSGPRLDRRPGKGAADALKSAVPTIRKRVAS